MMGATFAAGLLSLEPVAVHGEQLPVHRGGGPWRPGFVVLGILPFIEKSFRITTGMTLLELADASQPLLRRLGLEAPGTYAHSLQVANPRRDRRRGDRRQLRCLPVSARTTTTSAR